VTPGPPGGLPGSRARRGVEVVRLQIHPATRADAEAIARRTWLPTGPAYAGLIPAGVLAGLRAEDRLRRWQVSLSDPQRQTLIARDEDDGPALTGFAAAAPSQDDDAAAGTGELMARHVIQSHWRRGAGRVLHDAAVATPAARGF